jgi:dienelactone hydrolase
VIQGERDPFGRPEEFPADVDLTVVPGADHGFAVPKRAEPGQEEALARIAGSVVRWVASLG